MYGMRSVIIMTLCH